jgi:hypothetical protein
MKIRENDRNLIMKKFLFMGRKCKIFIHNNFIIIGFIFSMDNFFNFLVYDSCIFKKDKKKNFSKFYSFRFIRGDCILFIKFLN